MKTVKLNLLAKILVSPNALALTAGSPAHEPGMKFVNELLPVTQDEDLICGSGISLLPEDYPGNLGKEFPEMVRSGVAKGLHLRGGGSDDGDKKQSEQIIDAVQSTGMRLFRTSLGETYCAIPGKGGGQMIHPVKSDALRGYLRRQYFRKTGKPPASAAISEALDHFEAVALFDSPTEQVHIRVAGYQGEVYVDLGDETNRAIRINADGYSVTDEVPVNFIRPHGTFGALPQPEDGFDSEELRNLLGMDQVNFCLLIAFCISALNPMGPFFVLQIHGEHGSGKSNTAKLVKDIIDPNVADKLRMPRSEQDMAINAQGQWLLNYENLSHLSPDQSDMLCTIATGGAFSARKLYTDDEQKTFVFRRPVILNGIGNYAPRADLQDRSIPLNLTAISPEKRKTEREMQAALDRLSPGFLGYLYDCVSMALKRINEVEAPKTFRMADAAHWLLAAEPATGFQTGAIFEVLEKVQQQLMAQSVVNDTLTAALLEMLLDAPDNAFSGRFGKLFDLLHARGRNHGKGLPASPSALSSKIERLKPSMRKIGLEVDDGPRTANGQIINLRLSDAGLALARELGDPEKDLPPF
ncbi:hypothetical protein [Pseudogemmobacter bohemicus]|uniref:hypothetical protein n=1 Tax=Pseudogemmobacter bohemicus TaxID=2250708 RepID=UPI000DD3370C|nr:hypothetical protein [Pseudogemmobacter bohemicus]